MPKSPVLFHSYPHWVAHRLRGGESRVVAVHCTAREPSCSSSKKMEAADKKDPGHSTSVRSEACSSLEASPVQVCFGKLKKLQSWRLMSTNDGHKGWICLRRVELFKMGTLPSSCPSCSVQATSLLVGATHKWGLLAPISVIYGHTHDCLTDLLCVS